MNVPSLEFLVFAAIAAVIFNLSRAIWWRSSVFLVCNLAFVASQVQSMSASVAGYAAMFGPYVGFLGIGYAAIWAIQNEIGGARLVGYVRAAAIVLIIFAFFWLKKYSFLPSGTQLDWIYLTIGLSYVFFRVLHLVIDAGDADTIGRVKPLDYLNYTLNFTCLVSGPIQRYDDYARMTLHEPMHLGWISAGRALERIVIGLFKVLVIQGLISTFQHDVQADLLAGEPFAGRVRDGALLIAAYPVFLYVNFSGYTDFVIGIARFFGLELPENFDRPFSSASFIEYWSRWHMTLSNWLKTYVYNPLLKILMRRVRAKSVAPYLSAIGLLVTFFLIGVWHGRTSEFVVFGLLNGGGVAGNQVYRVLMIQRLGKKPFAQLGRDLLYKALCRGLTFAWLAFTLIWFWSDWSLLDQIGKALGPAGAVTSMLLIWLCASIVLAALEWLHNVALRRADDRQPLVLSRYLRTAWATALIVVIVGVVTITNAPAPDIVYKAF